MKIVRSTVRPLPKPRFFVLGQGGQQDPRWCAPDRTIDCWMFSACSWLSNSGVAADDLEKAQISH